MRATSNGPEEKLDLARLVQDRRVMVTGGAGFIGSHLVEVLSERNKVFVYDDLSTGALRNLDDLDAELVVGSLLDQDLLYRTVKGMDLIFHLGALPSVPRSVEDPVGSNLANQNGTLNLLMAAKEAKVERVVYASSSSVYGDAPEQPKREDMLPAPMSPVCGGETGRGILLSGVPSPLWTGGGAAAFLQRLRSAAGPQLSICRRGPQVHRPGPPR